MGDTKKWHHNGNYTLPWKYVPHVRPESGYCREVGIVRKGEDMLTTRN